MLVTVEVFLQPDGTIGATVVGAHEFKPVRDDPHEICQRVAAATVAISLDFSARQAQIEARALVSLATEKCWELAHHHPGAYLTVQPSELLEAGFSAVDLRDVLELAAPMISPRDAELLLGAVKTATNSFLWEVAVQRNGHARRHHPPSSRSA